MQKSILLTIMVFCFGGIIQAQNEVKSNEKSTPADGQVTIELDENKPALSAQNFLSTDKTSAFFFNDLGNKHLEYGIFNSASSFGTEAYINVANTDLRFMTNLTEHMRLTAGGNVGIGTASPSFKLDVADDSRIMGRLDIEKGNGNVFVGRDAGVLNTDGSSNTFVGVTAGASNTTGNNNTFIGFESGNFSTTGYGNTFVGHLNGTFNTTGFYNSFFGSQAGQSNTTGAFNSFFGSGSGISNTTGSFNNFFGLGAGFSNTTGSGNNFFGVNTGNNNTTGSSNSFFGDDAGNSNTTGSDNSFFGADAGRSNTTGAFNNFLGADAGRSNTIGGFNNFFGTGGGESNTTGSNNSFFGNSAGFFNTTGDLNIFVGENAGSSNTIGSGNIFIGTAARSNNSNSLFSIAIGNNAVVDCHNCAVIGGTGLQAVNLGINTQNPTERLHVVGNGIITGTLTVSGMNVPSDARLKMEIHTLEDTALAQINRLRPTSYFYKTATLKALHLPKGKQTGFIAQEVETLFPNLVYQTNQALPNTDEETFKAINYVGLIPVLTKGIQELSVENETIKAENAALKERLLRLEAAVAALSKR